MQDNNEKTESAALPEDSVLAQCLKLNRPVFLTDEQREQVATATQVVDEALKTPEETPQDDNIKTTTSPVVKKPKPKAPKGKMKLEDLPRRFLNALTTKTPKIIITFEGKQEDMAADFYVEGDLDFYQMNCAKSALVEGFHRHLQDRSLKTRQRLRIEEKNVERKEQIQQEKELERLKQIEREKKKETSHVA